MIAKVLVSENLEVRIKNLEKELEKHQLKREHVDVLYLDSEEKLGIEQSRAIKEFFQLKPFQAKGKAVIIEDLSNITPEAQNALLKLLEEPPQDAIILLATPTIHHLLPTVLSRVEVIQLNSPITETTDHSTIKKLLELPLEDRFKQVEKTTDKKELMQKLIHYTQDHLAKNPSFHKHAQEILTAEQWLNANVNQRGILEYLMLILKKQNS